MKENWFLQKLETSKTLRITLEILISLVLFSWLPLVFQIITGLIFSIIFEVTFITILARNLKNKYSGEALSQILDNWEKK